MGPDFICIGSQKAGTGSLYDLLRGHVETAMPPIKELHYFDNLFETGRINKVQRKFKILSKQQRQGKAVRTPDLEFLARLTAIISARDPNLARYKDLFVSAGDAVSGDITPAYATLPSEKIAEIANGLPETKIILLLREPVSRLWSHARMKMRRNKIRVTSQTNEFRKFCNRDGVRARSLQSQAYEKWKRHFGDRMIVLFFDDLRDEPEVFYRSLCRFLRLSDDPSKTSHPLRYNRKAATSTGQPMPDAMRQIAYELLDEEYDRLADFVGGHAINWREKHNEVRAR